VAHEIFLVYAVIRLAVGKRKCLTVQSIYRLGYGWTTEDLRFNSWLEKETFPSVYHPAWLWWPNQLLTNRYRRYFPAVKGPELEPYHSSSSGAELKKACSYTLPETP
jgi:hypothetical protein